MSPEKRRIRLKSLRESLTKAAETPEKKSTRLKSLRESLTKAHAGETPEKKTRCLNAVKQDMRKRQQYRKSVIVNDENVIQNFLRRVRDSADYICCSCNRLMYKCTVVMLKSMKQ